MDKGLDIDGRRTLLGCHAVLGALAARDASVATSARATLGQALRLVAAARRQPDRAAGERALVWAQAPGRHILVLGEPAYPALLAAIPTPPLVLFVEGRVDLLATPQIAVVGSRKASAGGLRLAQEMAAALAQAGLTVTSGMALGIDAAAHRGALAAAGNTLAVLGCGIDRVYPARHRELAGEIRGRGALVSEFALGAPPARHHFPRRNRIIAGLARGTLVIEAAARSGSLSTALHAAEQGREVFAVPGSVRNPQAAGCHALIKQGAKLTECVEDVLEELSVPGLLSPATASATDDQSLSASLDGDARRVLAACGWEPVTIETLTERSALTVSELSSILLALELDGLVECRANGTYLRAR